MFGIKGIKQIVATNDMLANVELDLAFAPPLVRSAPARVARSVPETMILREANEYKFTLSGCMGVEYGIPPEILRMIERAG